MLCIADEPLPEEAAYEDYPQIENGVGMMRQFLSALMAEKASSTQTAVPRRVLIPCGVSIAPYMQKWLHQFAPDGVCVTVQPIVNHFFGDTVTVTGLLTGRDIIAQTREIDTDEMILCSVTLQESGNLFLDDLTLEEFRAALPFPVRITANNGAALYQSLLGNQTINKEIL